MDYLLAFGLGALCGGVFVLWWHFERLVAGSEATSLDARHVQFKVDAAVLNQLNESLVMAWLDARGLMWMPKGMEKIVSGKTR